MAGLSKCGDSWARTTIYEYNDRNWVTKVTEPDPDGPGTLAAPVTTYAYNDAGWVTSTTDALSRTTSYQHDDERPSDKSYAA